jgi:3-polyprenyl-4-hydroxybenzoate decarboxylase
MVDHTVSRVVDLLGLPQTQAPRWMGLKVATQSNPANE